MSTLAKALVIIGLLTTSVAAQIEEGLSNERYVVDKQPLFTLEKKHKLSYIFVSPDRQKVALIYGKDKKFYVWTETGHTMESFQDMVPHVNFSPDSRRMAVIGDKKDGIYVYVDGMEHGPYKAVLEDSVVFSPDGSHYAFPAMTGLSITAPKYFTVVIDGREGPQYKHLAAVSPQFSPDSRKAVYFAGDDKHWFPVVNGIEGRRFEKTGNGPVFSVDGSLMAYTGREYNNDSAYIVVNDSVYGPFWDFMGFVFSPTSNDLAYSARKDRQTDFQVYLNHGPVGNWDFAIYPIFSPDGEQLAFTAKDSSGVYVVVDSVATRVPVCVWQVYFSPGGKHFYFEWSPDPPTDSIETIVFVVDGVAYPAMTGPLKRISRHWSPDDSRFAYSWDINEKERAVCIDSVIDSSYTLISDVGFSPDSKRWAYLGRKKGEEAIKLYLDGEVISRGEMIAPNVVFSPDSRDVAYTVWTADEKRYLVINDTEYEQFDEVYPMKVAFNDDGSITYYALQDKTVYRVTVRPVESLLDEESND